MPTRKTKVWGRGRGSRHDTDTDQWDTRRKRKAVQLPFPTFFLVADEGEGIIGNFNSARFDSVRR